MSPPGAARAGRAARGAKVHDGTRRGKTAGRRMKPPGGWRGRGGDRSHTAPSKHQTDRDRALLPTGQIDARYFEKPYYIAPREEVGQEILAVIRDAFATRRLDGLEASFVVARATSSWSSRWGNAGLRGEWDMRFSHEVRGAEAYFSDIRR